MFARGIRSVSSSLRKTHVSRGGARNFTSKSYASIPIPIVVDQNLSGERYAYDIFSRLLRERIVFINGPIYEANSTMIVAQLLFLEADNPKKPIHVYVNSPGGEISAGLAIYDTMQYVTAPVSTVCIGQACSMGSLLLTGGRPGMRKSLPNSEIMIHQPLSGSQGQASDIEIHTKHLLHLKDRLTEIYVKHTGKPKDLVEKMMDRDTWFTAERAKEFGLIDEIVTRKPAEETLSSPGIEPPK